MVSHEEGAFYHHLEVCTLPYDFIFPYVPGPFLRADGELGCFREVVDVFLTRLWSLPVSYYSSRMTVPIPLVLVIPQISLNSVSPPFSGVFYFMQSPK